MSWRWITKQALLLLHAESLAEHGGSAGIRDECLLDSALASPQNLLAYADAESLAEFVTADYAARWPDEECPTAEECAAFVAALGIEEMADV